MLRQGLSFVPMGRRVGALRSRLSLSVCLCYPQTSWWWVHDCFPISNGFIMASSHSAMVFYHDYLNLSNTGTLSHRKSTNLCCCHFMHRKDCRIVSQKSVSDSGTLQPMLLGLLSYLLCTDRSFKRSIGASTRLSPTTCCMYADCVFVPVQNRSIAWGKPNPQHNWIHERTKPPWVWKGALLVALLRSSVEHRLSTTSIEWVIGLPGLYQIILVTLGVCRFS